MYYKTKIYKYLFIKSPLQNFEVGILKKLCKNKIETDRLTEIKEATIEAVLKKTASIVVHKYFGYISSNQN